MDLEIAGDVAVVVGGARGLGRAIAEAFAAERAELVLVDRDPEVVRLAETIVEGRTSRAKAVVADVTDPAAMRDLAGTVRKWFGRCDHLLFAAGVGSGKFGFPFWNLDPTDWERVLRINLIGA